MRMDLIPEVPKVPKVKTRKPSKIKGLGNSVTGSNPFLAMNRKRIRSDSLVCCCGYDEVRRVCC